MAKFTPYGTNSEKDKLVNSEDWEIRETIAKQGYGLDVLVNDENLWVRAAVARQGYGLDILINDKEEYVRVAVVYQGYGLDALINDKSWYIRAVTRNYLADNNYTDINDWIAQNPDKCVKSVS